MRSRNFLALGHHRLREVSFLRTLSRPIQIHRAPTAISHFSIKLVPFLKAPTGGRELYRFPDQIVCVLASAKTSRRPQRNGYGLAGSSDAMGSPLLDLLLSVFFRQCDVGSHIRLSHWKFLKH